VPVPGQAGGWGKIGGIGQPDARVLVTPVLRVAADFTPARERRFPPTVGDSTHAAQDRNPTFVTVAQAGG
jgi:hypothetical protein